MQNIRYNLVVYYFILVEVITMDIEQLELINLIKKLIDISKKEIPGIKPSVFSKEYEGTKIHATLYRAYGGNDKYVDSPALLFLAYEQKTTNGIYPIIIFHRKRINNNFELGYGWSKKNMPKKTWNEQRGEDKYFKPKLQLSIKDEDDIENNKEKIIQNINNTIKEYHELFRDRKIKEEIREYPLNLVLYGPPGTGKTYNTIVKALEIIAQKDNNIKEKIEEYKKQKDRAKYYHETLLPEFNKFKNEGRIKFITFHQNYSYEDFIQGYKPQVRNNNMVYELKEGPLYKISWDALLNAINIQDDELNSLKTLFIEKYPVNSEFETVEGNKFRIVEYQSKSIRLKPLDGKTIYSFPYELLFKLYLEKNKTTIEGRKGVKKILYQWDTYKDHSSYFFPILKAFSELVPQVKDKDILKGKYTLKDNSDNYVLIIDEINRGNISKIFGELITLIEEDKRIGNKHALTIPLMYKPDKEFGLPNNLYIIGTMNTTDKSIALVDIALRRRFTFEEIEPIANLVPEKIESFKLMEFFERMNQCITNVFDNDKDHQIGHSYFININNIEELKNVWFKKIMPLLNEYVYGDKEKLKGLIRPFVENKIDITVDKEIFIDCLNSCFIESKDENN